MEASAIAPFWHIINRLWLSPKLQVGTSKLERLRGLAILAAAHGGCPASVRCDLGDRMDRMTVETGPRLSRKTDQGDTRPENPRRSR